jgi:LysR family tcuABC transcriptional regulator
MEIRQLRYFVVIVECGSLSRASRQLHIAQPALSQQLAKLEDEIGKPLLTRTSKGVTPTDNGQALYHHAGFLLRQLDQALSVVRRGSAVVNGMVSVGLPATTVATIGLDLVQRVRKRYPGILINVVEGMSGHIGHLMRLGQLDLAVLFNNNLAADLAVEPLFVEELFLIVPEHSTMVEPDRTSISIAEAAGLPIVLPTMAHGLRQRIATEFEDRDLKANIVAEIDSLALLMNCVHDGIGATIKPMGAVMQEGQKGRRWRCLSFSDVRFRRRNFLYSLPTERLTAASIVVATELRDAMHQLVGNNRWPGFEEFPGRKMRQRQPVSV